MQKKFQKWLLPAAMALFACAPVFAQNAAQNMDRSDHGMAGNQMPHNAPPRAKMEKRSARPSQNHTWIGGYWEPRNEQWAWAPGRWEEPSEKGARWTKPKYHHEKDSYRYEAGRWSH
jgi:hypothetical protein